MVFLTSIFINPFMLKSSYKKLSPGSMIISTIFKLIMILQNIWRSVVAVPIYISPNIFLIMLLPVAPFQQNCQAAFSCREHWWVSVFHKLPSWPLSHFLCLTVQYNVGTDSILVLYFTPGVRSTKRPTWPWNWSMQAVGTLHLELDKLVPFEETTP